MPGVGAIASSYAPAGGVTFVASDYGTVLAEWDFSDTSTITDAGAGAVSAVAAKTGGSGWDLAQGNAARQPTTGTRTLNGLNVLNFDGGDVLVGPSTAQAQPLHIVTVAARDNLTGVMAFVGRSGSVNFAHGTSAAAWRLHTGTALTGGTADTSAHVQVGHANGASSSIRIDGASVASGNAGTNGLGSAALAIGASDSGLATPLDGYIGHVLIYTAVTNLAGLEAALKAKWGTP